MSNGLSGVIEAVVGVIIIIILVVVFAPLLIEISSITNTESWGYLGAVLLVIFGVMVIIITILKLKD